MVESPRTTRRQHRKSLAEDANTAAPSIFRHITTVEGLIHFMELATLNPAIGSIVQTLTIDFKHMVSFSVSQLRAALLIVPNVQELLLYLPSPVPFGLLTDIRFRTLDFIATNIPHASLVSFLSSHPTVTSLVLGPCGKSKACPLAAVSTPNLVALECSVGCLSATSYSRLSRLTLDLPEAGVHMPTIIRHMTNVSSLSSLTVDFFPDDFDIVDAIADAIPQVRKLKLVEKKKPTVRVYLQFAMFRMTLTDSGCHTASGRRFEPKAVE
ncbi:hypothetical protein TRAPUB_8319 [Trametes pubescens]|uniref:F-box domain-containing protein n=1 Tax=Trametes pubescens TaxID=154538 RepID=A0A1M2W5T4_TRAPU|nr:hypothetical protein TRAPUB_8319 [Trametes pubescens]